jgi:hypothetical protein
MNNLDRDILDAERHLHFIPHDETCRAVRALVRACKIMSQELKLHERELRDLRYIAERR